MLTPSIDCKPISWFEQTNAQVYPDVPLFIYYIWDCPSTLMKNLKCQRHCFDPHLPRQLHQSSLWMALALSRYISAKTSKVNLGPRSRSLKVTVTLRDKAVCSISCIFQKVPRAHTLGYVDSGWYRISAITQIYAFGSSIESTQKFSLYPLWSTVNTFSELKWSSSWYSKAP